MAFTNSQQQQLLETEIYFNGSQSAVRLMKFIDQGGYGAVFKAITVRPSSNRGGKFNPKLRAVKILRKGPQATRESARRELELLATFSHPSFVKFFGFHEDDSTVFLVFEKCDMNADERVDILEGLDLAEMKRAVHQIATGIAALHNAGIAHRDLKLGNVLVSQKGANWDYKICDLGLATRVRLSCQFDLGSDGWIPPECLSANHKTSAYSRIEYDTHLADDFVVGYLAVGFAGKRLWDSAECSDVEYCKFEDLPSLPPKLEVFVSQYQVKTVNEKMAKSESSSNVSAPLKESSVAAPEAKSHWGTLNNAGDCAKYDSDQPASTANPDQRDTSSSIAFKVVDNALDGSLDFEEENEMDKVPGPHTETLGDDESDIDENKALMDPDDPLTERVQDALFEQSDHDTKLSNEIKQKKETVSKALKKRGKFGVELYSTQQQLARLRPFAWSLIAIVKNYREVTEHALSPKIVQYKEEIQKKTQNSENIEQHKIELGKLPITLKQINFCHDELRSKILVAKRTTLKAEKKKHQDYFINNLTDRLRHPQEHRALDERKKPKSSLETLHDASTEMEAIQFEKRQLLHQKSSLIGLQCRDKVLLNVDKGIQKNKDTILSVNGEFAGFKLSFCRGHCLPDTQQ
ncbi:Coiled-coil domain-containing protein 40, partial [Podochytrium sp. JEL0797]